MLKVRTYTEGRGNWKRTGAYREDEGSNLGFLLRTYFMDTPLAGSDKKKFFFAHQPRSKGTFLLYRDTIYI